MFIIVYFCFFFNKNKIKIKYFKLFLFCFFKKKLKNRKNIKVLKIAVCSFFPFCTKVLFFNNKQKKTNQLDKIVFKFKMC